MNNEKVKQKKRKILYYAFNGILIKLFECDPKIMVGVVEVVLILIVILIKITKAVFSVLSEY